MNPFKLDESPRSVAAPRQKIVASALWADVFPRLQAPRRSFNAGGQAPSFSFQLFRLSVDQRPSAVKKLAANFFHLPSSLSQGSAFGCDGGKFGKSFLNKYLDQNQAKKRENREKYVKKVNRS